MLTLTSTGRLWHDDCSAVTNFETYTEVNSTITIVSGNIVMASTNDANGKCSIVYKTALPSNGIWVVRTQAQQHTPVGTRYNGIGIESANAQPTAASRDLWGGEQEPSIHFNDWLDATHYWCYWPSGAYMDAVNFPGQVYVADTWYAWEIESVGVGSQVHKARGFTADYAALSATATKTATRGQNPCWVYFTGNTNGFTSFGQLTVEYVQAMLSLDITVTGLDTGNAVRIYDKDGNLLQSAVEAGGTAVLDMRGVARFDTNTCPQTSWGGFRGTIVPYEDNTYTKPLTTYRSNSIWGGDIYAFTGSTNRLRKPHSIGARR